MKRRAGTLGGRRATLGIALATVVIVTLAWVATASASPPGNTISESDLSVLLQSGNPVTGYFETVLGGATLASQSPVDIPVTIQGIVPDAGPAGDLIFFQASGAQIDAVGGIAEAMSGSPLYVDDNGTPELAGAVSYGDAFTTHDFGLATPIADMTALESTYFAAPGLTRATRLPATIATPEGAVTQITVASSRAAAARLHPAAGAVVMAPLASVQVNGLIVGSPVYKKLAARFAALGLDLTPQSAGLALDLPQLPDLTAGSSLGVMYADGDFAAGGLGTVTYVDPANDVLVAFGHPLDYFGPVSLDLTSAWVQGIWSDGYIPYKVMSPVEVLGAITQDRGAGVAGTIGAAPVEVPVSSSATLDGVTRTTLGTITQGVVDNPNLAGMPGAAAAVAMQRVTDTGSFPGSATATATIVVSDGANDYQIQRADIWDDPFDVMSVATGDIDNALGTLTSGLPGLSPKVESIDFSADLSAAHRSATIEDVTVPDGLKVGGNSLTVSLLAADGQTVTEPVTLTIPRGTSTSGTLTVSSATSGSSSGSGFGQSTSAGSTAPQTLAQVVAAINAAPKNSDLDVVYSPDNQGAVVKPVEVLADTRDFYVEGEVDKTTGDLQVMAPRIIDYGDSPFVTGTIGEADGSTTVSVYERPSGLSQRLVATLPAAISNDGSAVFGAVLPPLKTTVRLTVVWHGDADHLSQSVTRTISVRARVSLSATVRRPAGHPIVAFTARLAPAQTSGRVVVEHLLGKRWVSIANLAASGSLSGSWRPAAGSYELRAVFEGSSRNATATSGVARVAVP